MERYTPQAKEALSLAVGVAESLNHGYVGTEHLLIGLLHLTDFFTIINLLLHGN